MAEVDSRDLIRRSGNSDPPPESSLYLFYSFDLVDSTRLKGLKNNWESVIREFYSLVQRTVDHSGALARSSVWKYVGDEVLLHKRVGNRIEVLDFLPGVHHALIDIVDRLHSLYPEDKHLISAKAAAWCARVRSYGASRSHASGEERDGNIETRDPHTGRSDFIGPDIDIGFRVAKHSLGKRLAVSADLAWLSWRVESGTGQDRHIDEKIRIVDYKKLKGVWSDRMYPVIWYEQEWEGVKDTFVYDDKFKHELATKLCREGAPDKNISKLDKIYHDLNRESAMRQLEEFVLELKENEFPDDSFEPVTFEKIEVHVVAICFNSEGKFLAAKRPSNKRRLPDKWEFGCGQLSPGETFEDALAKAYKEDFSLDLRTPVIPVSTFIIDDGDRSIPGLIFAASIKHDQADPKRHQEIRWIAPGDISLEDGDCVDDFKRNARLAGELWERYNSGNVLTDLPSR